MMNSPHSPYPGIFECPPMPEYLPVPQGDSVPDTSVSVSIVEGATLNLWSDVPVTPGTLENEVTLQLQPNQAVVIGRQEGGQIEYLDPQYQPTQLLPNTHQAV